MASPSRWTSIGLSAVAIMLLALLAAFIGGFVSSMLREPTWGHLTALLWTWQTFIAGLLALIAGVGTVWATWSATREAWNIERRRIAREAYAFFEMMDAAVEAVLDDVIVARSMAADIQENRDWSPQAFHVRQRIKKGGFSELRGACPRYGGQLVTLAFLRLDKEIDDFASKVRSKPTHWNDLPEGEHASLHDQLDTIARQAKGLSDIEVGPAKKRCLDTLRKMPGSDFP